MENKYCSKSQASPLMWMVVFTMFRISDMIMRLC